MMDLVKGADGAFPSLMTELGYAGSGLRRRSLGEGSGSADLARFVRSLFGEQHREDRNCRDPRGLHHHQGDGLPPDRRKVFERGFHP